MANTFFILVYVYMYKLVRLVTRNMYVFGTEWLAKCYLEAFVDNED